MASAPAPPPIVYLVEDDEVQLQELEACVRRTSFDVTSFACGSAAIDALYASDRPAIVVCDLRMPEVSGWGVAEAVQRLRSRDRAIAIVMVTGFLDRGTIRRAFQMRVDDLIGKPIDAPDLVASIQRLGEFGGVGAAPAINVRDPVDLAEIADTLLNVFEMCDRRLPPSVRSEPHIRMMMYCVRQHLCDDPPSISSTCYASGQPMTTALRRLHELVSAGMFVKSADDSDKRRSVVRPTADLLSRLERLGSASSRVNRALLQLDVPRRQAGGVRVAQAQRSIKDVPTVRSA